MMQIPWDYLIAVALAFACGFFAGRMGSFTQVKSENASAGSRAMRAPNCWQCHYPMEQQAYIAHGFKRLYVCPLCNLKDYVDDPDLKRQKIAEIEARRQSS